MELRRHVRGYIRESWRRTVRSPDSAPAGMLSLPHRYTVPCIDGRFQALFYWDTYFANLGLLADGLTEVAADNVRNLVHLVERFGFVPNSTYAGCQNRSQPPYLALMAGDLLRVQGGDSQEERMIHAVRAEYAWWAENRSVPVDDTGARLNRHGHHADPDYLARFYLNTVRRRLALPDAPEDEARVIAAHRLAEAETGWDFTPRFGARCEDFVPVDLNSNLFAYERFLGGRADRADKTGRGPAEWLKTAGRRREVMRRYLWSPTYHGLIDWDRLNAEPAAVPSLACFHPLWVGLVGQEQAEATSALLPLFEQPFGLSVCPRGDRDHHYQWDYPNMWPPLIYTTVLGLLRYGKNTEAERVAGKYLDTCTRVFARTGRLWEKYDAVTGEPAAGEYEAQEMMGWTAGVFAVLDDLLSGRREPAWP